MCLVITQLEPKIADKDIICYKLVERTKIKGVYKSKFQGFEYVIRQLYTNNLDIRFANKSMKRYFYMGFYKIEEGMFHSYINYLYSMRLKSSLNYTLLKCIIPKGAYYFKGFSDYFPSYASSQIKILEEI